ncbi:MazG-like family protein [Cytobacillus purgationiresistens]|uniref:NTP pyrophosphatase (Non-canonical NTP hydrolase) n=1 Tax=Cytobacillus purgationiresistens TaxID=863449 RepID=A0ABU0AL57_9BACI|nr:MazG-like family protein [Cytobacillus purgationiresistens]MDQ0271624.1 NTP pyrophosphatase (non-canonical NTP hydrolase) [Cytobacillus purgationiresistens]
MLNISELQKNVQEFSEVKGFDQSTVEARTLFLVTEVGEVAKEVLSLSWEKDPEKVKERLGLELYDVVWNVCELANKLDIDLEEAFRKKMEINSNRSWK